MIYRYAEIKDLDEIMGLYKEASLNEWCTWDDSYPDTGICKKDIGENGLDRICRNRRKGQRRLLVHSNGQPALHHVLLCLPDVMPRYQLP